MTRRLSTNVVGTIVVLIVAAGSLLTPGIRHTHEGGETAHSHSAESRGVAWTNHYPLQFGSSLRTRAVNTKDETAVTTHVHMSFLGFQLTLLDSQNGGASGTTLSDTAENNEAREIDLVEIRSPYTATNTIKIYVPFVAPVPSHVDFGDSLPTSDLVQTADDCSGRHRDAPTTPPPEFC